MRFGKTLTIAKIPGHAGDPMNEKADDLADRATYLPPDMHFMTFRHECLFSVAGDPPRPWPPHVCKLLVQHFAQRQWTQQQQRDPLRKPNCTEAWLSTEGAYREVLGSVLHQQKFDTQLKHTVQAITRMFPTQRWVHAYVDPRVTPSCKLCGYELDSVGHFQCR